MSTPAASSSSRGPFLRAAAAVLLGGLALNGCDRAEQSSTPKPTASTTATAAPQQTPAPSAVANNYLTRLSDIEERQAHLSETTDEEFAGHRLNELKKLFATDAVLDPTLPARDLARLHARFNALASEDGIRFRFEATQVGARRDCLAIHPERKNRYARAQAVETCMIRLSTNRLTSPSAK